MANKVLLVGGGAREHAIGVALCRNGNVDLYTTAHNRNPGLDSLSREYLVGDEKDVAGIVGWARAKNIDLAVIGLEDPLKVGLVDALWAADVPTIGPSKVAAQLETSKLFTRELMKRHRIDGQADFHYFKDVASFTAFLTTSSREYALKPVGLTAGQGVKVMGAQLKSLDEALAYGTYVIEHQVGGIEGLVVEERLLGHEFTLQCFVDGKTVVPMPLVRDYKRAYEGENGPNTGSMGAYSQSDGLLPFVDGQHRSAALDILIQITRAIEMDGCPYQGIMYGQFMRTSKGVQLVEINARFGDPEAINVLALLETDLLEICKAIVEGTLDKQQVRFARRASVCSYITPPNYGANPQSDVPLTLDLEKIKELDVDVLFAKVEQKGNAYLTTKSRSIALLALADDLDAAADAVENALKFVTGDYHMRHDIGCEYEGVSPRRAVLTSVS
ncbi:MAG: phosphoribosylamine--glycine ligase [Chloroflexota bacterium]|nr:phosphoribosylamine--glycine ligase [Chloroflexota bacterium]